MPGVLGAYHRIFTRIAMYFLSDHDLIDLGFSSGPMGHTFRQDFSSGGQDFYMQLYQQEDSPDMKARVYGIDLTEDPSWVLLDVVSFRNKPALAEYISQFGFGTGNFQKVNRLTL